MRLFLVSAALTVGVCALAPAQESKQIVLTAGKSVVIKTTGDLERVAVASEEVLEAVAVTQREVILNGKTPGETTVLIWQKNGGGRQSFDVRVEPSTSKLDALRRSLRSEVGDGVQAEL